MRKYYIDFSKAKTIGEIHLALKEQLKLPDWYGENLDALWDMLTGHIEPGEMNLLGLHKLPNSLYDYSKKLLETFKRAEELDDYSIIVDDD
ncbi:MAG: barstar family protein [Oscillospiraceae bacterium]|nr:barstar family protein [Oscillospiraceae bacterium]